MLKHTIALLMVASCAWAGAQEAARPIPAYNTYLVAPYSIDAARGLARALATRLNAELPPEYQLEYRPIPRTRLHAAELSKDERFEGVVLFIAPRFVGDPYMTRYLWSKPLFVDCNLLISGRMQPIEYEGAASLVGRRFAGVRGYRYELIDQMAVTRRLQREDSQDELSGLQKVGLGRADFTVVPYTIYAHAAADKELGSLLHVASRAHQCFTRRILIGKATPPGLLKAINQAIDTMAADEHWRALLGSYHLDLDVLAQWTAHPPADGQVVEVRGNAVR